MENTIHVAITDLNKKKCINNNTELQVKPDKTKRLTILTNGSIGKKTCHTPDLKQAL